MAREFAEVFASLRAERGLSQRQAAADLGISQALLSHYEKGIRQPRFEFVVRACGYYGVSADYMLGISDVPINPYTAALPRRDGAEDRLLSDGRLADLLHVCAVTARLLCQTYGDGAMHTFYEVIGAHLYEVLRLFETRARCDVFGDGGMPVPAALLTVFQEMEDLRLRQLMRDTDGETEFLWDRAEAERIRDALASADRAFRALLRHYENDAGEDRP